MKMQLKDPQDVDLVLDPVTVQARPPNRNGSPPSAGQYDFVLVHQDAVTDDTLSQADFRIQGMQ